MLLQPERPAPAAHGRRVVFWIPGIIIPATVILFVFGVGLAARWALGRVERTTRRSLQSTLLTVLGTTREATRNWATRQETLASYWAASPVVVHLIQNARHDGTAPAALRTLLVPILRINDFDGFWLVTPELDPVASGQPDGAPPAELTAPVRRGLARALAAGTSLTQPFPPAGSSPSGNNPDILLAVSPVRDARGRILGVLGFRIDARKELSRLALRGRILESGETYFYDPSGRLLSGSRFDDSTAIGTVHQTTLGMKAGLDLDGYTGYRPARVVGAWSWDSLRGVGIATEIDGEEAFEVVRTARRALFAALGLAAALTVAMAASLRLGRHKTAVLTETQHRLAAVLEATTDFVCFTDAAARVLYVNEAGRRLLGIDPESAHADGGAGAPAWTRAMLRAEAFAGAVKEGVWSGESTVLMSDAREVTLSQITMAHRRPDGSIEFFSTIARDISDQKRLKQSLFEAKERAEVTLGSIGDAV
ncbi:MAG: PAS domain-containing protein, partial [Gemmatimonadota bacterium]